jgi:HEAT repeat protein
VVIAGHTGDDATALSHVSDPDGRVRASALRALQRTHRLSNALIDRALADPDPTVRRTAAELAASSPGVALEALLADPEASVVEVASWALGEWGQLAAGAVGTLSQVATGHSDSLCREAATAALGAIGDQRGLAAILEALSDKATVRRRATIALAAFDGAVVDAALERCLDDRDWQVRQVAEDLLDRRTGS